MPMRGGLVARDLLSWLCGEVSGRDVLPDVVNEVLSKGKAAQIWGLRHRGAWHGGRSRASHLRFGSSRWLRKRSEQSGGSRRRSGGCSRRR